MVSVSENLKERKENINDEDLADIINEALENQDNLTRELEEPTLKHGTDTINYTQINQKGLIPGSDNPSDTGESAEGTEVAFSTSFATALRYAELTEASILNNSNSMLAAATTDYGSVENPMVSEIPVSEIDKVSVRNNSAMASAIDLELNPYVAGGIMSQIENPGQIQNPERLSDMYEGKNHTLEKAIRGDERASSFITAIYSEDHADTELLRSYGVFRELSCNEVDGKSLKEVNTDYAPINEEATIYVPAREVDKHRQKASEQGFKADVHSIEARALVHEERIRETYENQGTMCFEHPADTDGSTEKLPAFVFEARKTGYDTSQETVDISTLRGKPVYKNESRI